jgi:hypothetical protein
MLRSRGPLVFDAPAHQRRVGSYEPCTRDPIVQELPVGVGDRPHERQPCGAEPQGGCDESKRRAARVQGEAVARDQTNAPRPHRQGLTARPVPDEVGSRGAKKERLEGEPAVVQARGGFERPETESGREKHRGEQQGLIPEGRQPAGERRGQLLRVGTCGRVGRAYSSAEAALSAGGTGAGAGGGGAARACSYSSHARFTSSRFCGGCLRKVW